MPKIILLKKPKDSVTRSELIEYLKNVHGPRNARLPGIKNYTLMVQVDPNESEDLPDGIEYYDAMDTIPAQISGTSYDTVEIHEFETMADLRRAHNSTQLEEAGGDLHDLIDFEDEITIVVDDEEIADEPHL
jgi:hypothetical protein